MKYFRLVKAINSQIIWIFKMIIFVCYVIMKDISHNQSATLINADAYKQNFRFSTTL